MSGDGAPRRAGRAVHVAVLLAGLAATGLVGCGGGDSEGSTGPRLGDVCEAIGIAQRILAPAGVGFADLVDDAPWSDDERSAVATIRLVGDGVDAGRFQPLLDHLAERHERELAGEASDPLPEPSDAVRARARELDAELADGGCG